MLVKTRELIRHFVLFMQMQRKISPNLMLDSRSLIRDWSNLVTTFTTAMPCPLTRPSLPSIIDGVSLSPTETTRFPIIDRSVRRVALTAKFVSSVRSHGERRRLDRGKRRERGKEGSLRVNHVSCEWK